MSNSYTNANTQTYSAADTRKVLGKMKDDFMNAGYRGFTRITQSTLMQWWEDVFFVANERALKKCQLKFQWAGREASLTYEMIADGSIKIDSDSAATNFYSIPKEAQISIVISKDNTNVAVREYLNRRGWTGTGSFHLGVTRSEGSYSSGNLGVNISTSGF